jgi:RNA-directed DNA polymerase
MKSVSAFIENRLKLVINHDKSKVAKAKQVKFLGMTIVNGKIAISKKALEAASTQIH